MIEAFTVIIPTFNRPDKTDRAIASVLAQTMQPFQIIVVDDGSYPPFKSEHTNNKIKFIRHKKNLGPSAARNTGLKACNTEWATFLDSDDWLTHDSLEKRIQSAAANESKQIYACAWASYDENSDKIISHQFPRTANSPLEHYAGIWFCPGSCIIFNVKTILSEVGLFDVNLKRYEDFELFCRLSDAGFQLQTDDFVGVNITHSSYADISTAQASTKRIEQKIKQQNLEKKRKRRILAYINYELCACYYYAGNIHKACLSMIKSFFWFPRTSINPVKKARKIVKQ